MLVDETTGEVKWDLQDPGEMDATAAMSPDGSLVASVGNNDPQWKLWDASGGLHRMGATHDGSGACNCGVPVLDQPLVVQEGCPVVAQTKGIRALAFSPCGQRLATGGEDTAVISWDTQTGEAAHRMTGHSMSVLALSFSADGERLASGSDDGKICIWECDTWALLRTILQAHEHPQAHEHVNSLHFSPSNNRTLASAGYTQVALWDVDTGERIRSFHGAHFAVFSPDGRAIATSNYANDVLLVDPETGDLVASMVGHSELILSASFSVDDGTKLASGSFDGTCKVWDPSTGALMRTIEVGAAILSVTWGIDWVRDTQRGVAFAMGHHPRLGAGSQVLDLDAGVVRMILDRV